MPTKPPFPQRLERKRFDPNVDALLEGLENVCVRIALLHAIREIPIYDKFIKDTCMKGPGRKKKKDLVTINIVGQLSDIMLGKIVNPKYEDPRSPIVLVNSKNCMYQIP